MVICLEQGADLHMAQLMPLPLTVSCFSKIQIGFTFLVPAHPGSAGKGAVKWVCVLFLFSLIFLVLVPKIALPVALRFSLESHYGLLWPLCINLNRVQNIENKNCGRSRRLNCTVCLCSSCSQCVQSSSSSSSSSFILPNNTTVCTFISIQFQKSRTARSDKDTNSCPKTCNKTVTGYIFYHTSKILQTRKLEKSVFSMLFLKTFKDVKFTVDGSRQ